MSTEPIPKLTPNPLSGAQRLANAKAWSEEPAKAAANALKPTPASTPLAAAAPPAALPWEQISDGTTTMTIRVPASVAAKLRFLGGTTYGQTINSLAVQALAEKVDALLRERGLLS